MRTIQESHQENTSAAITTVDVLDDAEDTPKANNKGTTSVQGPVNEPLQQETVTESSSKDGSTVPKLNQRILALIVFCCFAL